VAKVKTMRKEFIFQIFVFYFFITSCGSFAATDSFPTPPSPSATHSLFTETPNITYTATPLPSNTTTPTITPAVIEEVEIDDLAITEKNAGRIVNLSVFGAASDSCLISPNLDTVLEVQMIDGTPQYLLANKELEGQSINIWDIEAEKVIQTFDGLDIDSIFFHPDKNALISFANREKSVISFWDIASGKLRNQFVLNRKNMYYDDYLSFSKNGLRASTFSGYGNALDIRVSEFDFQSAALESQDYSFALYSEEGPTSTQFYSPKGNLVAVVNGIDDKLHFLDLTNDRDILLEFPFGNYDEIISAGAVFSKASMSWDERYIVSGALNGEIYVWSTADGSLLTILKAHKTRGVDGWGGGIKNLEFSPAANVLLSVGYDGSTRLWNIPSGVLLKEIDTCHHFGGFTQDGRYLITMGKNGIEKWGLP
jgi:WD40 repeat protein